MDLEPSKEIKSITAHGELYKKQQEGARGLIRSRQLGRRSLRGEFKIVRPSRSARANIQWPFEVLSSMDIRERMKRSFRLALALAPDAEVESLEYRNNKGWDSIGHMQLVAEIEKEFSIMLETDDILNMNSFEKAVEVVAKYVN